MTSDSWPLCMLTRLVRLVAVSGGERRPFNRLWPCRWRWWPYGEITGVPAIRCGVAAYDGGNVVWVPRATPSRIVSSVFTIFIPSSDTLWNEYTANKMIQTLQNTSFVLHLNFTILECRNNTAFYFRIFSEVYWCLSGLWRENPILAGVEFSDYHTREIHQKFHARENNMVYSITKAIPLLWCHWLNDRKGIQLVRSTALSDIPSL